MATVTTVTPGRPWVASNTARLTNSLSVLVCLAAAALVVLVTPLAGIAGIMLVGIPLSCTVSFFRGRVEGTAAAINRVVETVVVSATVVIFLPWISIFVTLIQRGHSAIYRGFFTHDMRVTAPDDVLVSGGIKHAIIGTLIMVLGAAVVAVPLGIFTAVYITEIRGRFTKVVRFLVQAMSGVPSIVAGLFIYALIVVQTRQFSALSGALALSVLMIPTVARTSEEVLRLVGEELRYGAYALGSSQASNVFRVVLPSARSGLVTSAILGVARIAGETAPLLATAQYFIATKWNPIKGPIGSLPAMTWSLLQTGTDNAVARAWATALTLIVLVALLFVLARLLSRQRRVGK